MDEVFFSFPLSLVSICNVGLYFSVLSLKPYIGEGISVGLKGLVLLFSTLTFFCLITGSTFILAGGIGTFISCFRSLSLNEGCFFVSRSSSGISGNRNSPLGY